MMSDNCLASLEEMLKPEWVCELSENSATNVSQVHLQVSADKQQPESLLQQDLSEGTSTDANEMQCFTDAGMITIDIMTKVQTSVLSVLHPFSEESLLGPDI